jgi:hypothetical protein
MIEDPFDLKAFALPPEMVRERSVSVPRKIRHGHWIQVPCWWVERLAKATRYRVTFIVALHLLYEHWRHRGRPIKLANGALEMEGVPRGTKWRALKELEQAGLISVQRRRRKSPVITVQVQRP